MAKDEITAELEQIRKSHRGVLRPGDVVEFAKDESTALHDRFEWDDWKCGQEYRLWQARELIRVHVTVLTQDSPPVRAYVSLQADRQKPGGGYRAITNVMRSDNLRAALLAEALDELERVRTKYGALKALAPVFAAMDKVKDASEKAA